MGVGDTMFEESHIKVWISKRIGRKKILSAEFESDASNNDKR